MDQGHNNFFFCLLLILSACTSKTPEERLLSLIEEKYANLYYNNEPHKRAVVEDLRGYLKNHPLNDQTIEEVKTKLNHINDGHVIIFDDRKEKNTVYSSGVKFLIGSEIIESCMDCNPILPKNKYQILEVNNLSYADFYQQSQFEVAASSEWGRHYRVSRLLTQKSNNAEVVLKVKDLSGKSITTTLKWKVMDSKKSACVTGERITPDIFKVHVASLWCDESSGTSWNREQIVENFRNQFDTVMNEANEQDKIILELRENGGGGDEEVKYIINAFIEKPVLLYHFKYLTKTHPGNMKWITEYLPFIKRPLWAADEYEYTGPAEHKPKKTFYKNKMATIISSGCFSSCETIVSILKNEKRSPVIGSVTHGGSGDPVIFDIKNTHYSINLPTCVNWQVPGMVYEGVGVQPNITAYQNPNTKEDSILNAAIDLTR